MGTKKRPDYILLGVTVFLILIGLLILSSVSAFLAEKNLSNPYYFFSHQVLFGVFLGIILGFLAFKTPLAKLKRWSIFLLLLNIILLSLVFVPGLGFKSGGATRWLKVGSLTFQPSEILKITFPLYLAAWLSSRQPKRGNSREFSGKAKSGFKIAGLSQNFIPFLVILAVISLFLTLQSDIGTLAVIAGVAILVYFIAGTPLWHIFLILGSASVALFTLIRISSYRTERWLVFFNPDIDPMGISYHVKQAMIAVGSGGIWGKGFGLSQQKLGFLPQTLGDSIFAIFAEEAGFLGAAFLIFLFLIFLWRGLKITNDSKDLFLKLLSFGIFSQIVLQAFVNIGALIGLLPLVGIPLPFISYGGTHLVIELIGVGILLNISSRNIENEKLKM